MEGTGATIEIRVEDLSQLFDSLDPFPFRERDLDKSAEEYIVGWAREIGKSQAIEIVIHVPRSTKNITNANDVQNAIRKYFAYKADLINRDLSELFRIGRQSLLVGVAVLGSCVVLREFSLAVLGTEGVGRALNEGLLILGWVANWRPLEIFLYDWWPLTRRRDLYKRLSRSTVLILASESDIEPDIEIATQRRKSPCP